MKWVSYRPLQRVSLYFGRITIRRLGPFFPFLTPSSFKRSFLLWFSCSAVVAAVVAVVVAAAAAAVNGAVVCVGACAVRSVLQFLTFRQCPFSI